MKKSMLVGFCLWLMGLCAAHAMTLQSVDNQLFAKGPIGGNDFTQFKTALENPQIDTVVLVNSPGGDLWTGLNVARLITEKGYRTVAVGSCMSACSVMFMAGKQRRFANALRPEFNVIGLHGAHDSFTKRVNPALQPQLYAFYKNTMGASFQAEIINQALYDMQDAGGMLRIPESTRAKEAKVYHCRGQKTPRKQCTEYPEQNGVRLGVLSDDTLETITLPAAMQELPTVLGKPLDQTFDSLEGHLLQLAERQCRSDSCKANAKKWADLEENKAIAVRTQGLGFGWKNNASSAIVSMVQAIYACNHARNSPVGLCRAESVNGYDVRHLYTQAAQEHSKALEDLRVPADKFYGNEEYGGALTSAKGYRLSDVHDATPQSLAHIRTIGTQDLAKALLGPVRPVVIDVWGGANDALPTAETLLNGGLAFDNSEKELPYHQRFAALLNLLAPDKNRPIVFYCTGHDCWLSANAAMRAVEAGYTQVLWYRGGYSAWKAAALPTALLQLQAVAY